MGSGSLNAAFKRVEPFAKRRGTPLPVQRFELLAIDPGEHTGWAVFCDKKLLGCGLGEPPIERVDRIVIELPQVYPLQPVPPNDLITLAFLAGRYAGVAATVEVSTVLPHQWKGNMPKEACAARVRHALSPEERAVEDACAAGVPEKQMHNVKDAIGIGLFASGRAF
jgi:hypothetical protein